MKIQDPLKTKFEENMERYRQMSINSDPVVACKGRMYLAIHKSMTEWILSEEMDLNTHPSDMVAAMSIVFSHYMYCLIAAGCNDIERLEDYMNAASVLYRECLNISHNANYAQVYEFRKSSPETMQ